ncbi:DUF4974 domain-containing protein [Sphingobacterium sp. DK4209]|uniref:DUF4974 domain-containing protein n=1 Tax=Sphingobacterium zhuxiongii TaxID=2662364 RepID=A0A5Q0QA72_9SPHI|nr:MULTISPECIES: FecR family protein [unclassified Sphingobacterium]MVZ65241.1 DUF4974 domain-containing protein [Sphingobacterium sp. DK4209]QGA26336.1 DUF4974 domain-containing protein [Sphingobacterium sp. dk4302]
MNRPDLDKFLNNQCSFEEAKAIVDDILANRISIDEIDLFDQVSEADLEAVDYAFKRRLQGEYFPRRKYALLYRTCRIAAAAVLLMCFTVPQIEQEQPQYSLAAKTTLFNTHAFPVQAILPDSSSIVLRANAQISYATNFIKNRQIKQTQGSVSYTVTKDPQHPFQVVFNEVSTTAIGTVFSIEQPTNYRAKISLHEGKVLVRDIAGKRTGDIYLNPGQSLIIDAEFATRFLSSNKKSKLPNWNMKSTSVKLSSSPNLQWTNDHVGFQKVGAREVFNIIEQLFDIKIIVNEDDIMSNSFTGSIYRKDNLATLLKNIAVLMDITYAIENDVIIISKGKEDRL